MKRRFLVAAVVDPLSADTPVRYVNTVITLEPEERLNAVAVTQIQELIKADMGTAGAVILSFQQLEPAEPRYALHDQLRDDWMEANTYCTDNGIEGPENSIRLLIQDHKRVSAQREHLQGLLKTAMTGLIEVSHATDLTSAQRRAENAHASIRTLAVALNLDEADTVAPRHPMTPGFLEYAKED